MPLLSPSSLESHLREIVKRLRAALAPSAIYFFGSYLYGTPGPHSDIDLLVIVDETNQDAFERDATAYRALAGLGIPKDVQVYTRREFDERAALPISFERTAKEKGRLQYAA